MSKNKEVWEELGSRDPYFAVATHEEYRSGKIDEAAKRAFFASGKSYLDEVWAELEAATGKRLEPETSLDYGCGVGRVLLPLAQRSKTAVGVDISHSMLGEVRKNAELASVSNIRLQDVAEFNASDSDRYDLVHCFIVLQHIPADVGYAVVDRLTSRLSAGGCAMIHVTYKNTAPLARRLRFRLYRDVPGAHRLSNFIQRRDYPFMPMYEYDLGRVKQIFGTNGCRIVGEKDTDHGFRGKMFYLTKDE